MQFSVLKKRKIDTQAAFKGTMLDIMEYLIKRTATAQIYREKETLSKNVAQM